MMTTTVVAKKGHFEYTPNAKAAYHKIINLRFKEAQPIIQKIKQETPQNLVVHHLENYIDFLKAYIDEDAAEFHRAETRKNRRLSLIEQGDSDSPYYLFLQADIRLQWAVARIKFEQYSGAFFDINQAFKLLNQNVKKFPQFMPNKKDLGILHAMVSALPNHRGLEWVSSLEGDYRKGKRELEEVIRYARKSDFLFEQETHILYAYVLLQFGKDEEGAWKAINKGNLKPKESPTAAFILANVATESGRNDLAINLLMDRPKGEAFHPFPYLDYMLGKAKLHRLDGNADRYLKKYLASFKGRNFIKQSYRLLAWHELVHDRPKGFQQYMAKVKNSGNSFVAADQSALKEATAGTVPDKNVLKARLLFDGAYYQRAYNMLILQSHRSFEHPKTSLEYDYFLGRCTHQMKRYEEALVAYKKVIRKGKEKAWYYACRAALESGRIYQAQGKKEKARIAYQECLSIRPKEHRTSLHQQAKTGLNLLK